MNNLPKIRQFSKGFHLLLSSLRLLIPLYYVLYWVFINYLPKTLITVNTAPERFVDHTIPLELRIIGFMTSLLPLSALIYGVNNLRNLFLFYIKGKIFSSDHVLIFKRVAISLLLWVLASIVYESSKSVLFSAGNPPGQRVLNVGFTSSEFTLLVVGGIAWIIAWVMDEGRMMNEERELTI